MSGFHSTLSRRDFMKICGLGAVGAAALTAPVFHDLDEVTASDSGVQKLPWYVKQRELENPTTEIDYSMVQPYLKNNTLNNATFAANYIPNYADEQTKAATTKTQWITANKPGFRLQDWALNDSASIATGGTFPWAVATTATTPTKLGVPKYTGTPEENARLLRSALRFFGVPMIGFTNLTAKMKKFVYADYPFDPNSAVGYTGTNGTNYLPGPANLSVAEIAFPSSVQAMYASPSMIGKATNGGMGHLMCTQPASSAQRFITELGYQCMHGGLENCVLHPAFGSFGGISELGRATNQMIAWDFGMAISPTSITFDLPIAPNQPIDAGIQEFCRKCAKCSDVCPSGSLTYDDLSWDIGGPWDVPGHKQFQHKNLPGCRLFNTQINGYCMTCQASCVFTKGSSSIHDMVRSVVATTGTFDGFFKKMDDAFGYGDLSFNQKNNPLTGHFNDKANDWWNLEQPIMGLDKSKASL